MTSSTEQNGRAANLQNVYFSYRSDSAQNTGKGRNGSGNEINQDSFALRDVVAEIPKNKVTVILGASGSGKSTLLRTLNAIIPSLLNGEFRGDISVLGSDITDVRTKQMSAQVGLLLQDYEAHLFRTNVEADAAFGPENLSVPPKEVKTRIKSALKTVGLTNLDRSRSPETLSGGQKQRLALAGILAMEPKLLVLDEPGSDLDPERRLKLIQLIESFVTNQSRTSSNQVHTRKGPNTVVIATHSIRTAMSADHAIVLADGQVIRQGAVSDVLRDVASLRQADIGVPPIVEAFSRLGWHPDERPLTSEAAEQAINQRGLDWTPPAWRSDSLPGVPANNGRETDAIAFDLDDVSYRYSTDNGSVRGISDIDLTINEGEIVAIVGANGSGKTTLAKHLNGLLAPETGVVRFQGQDLTGQSPATLSRKIGYLFQNPDHQLFKSTVREEIAFGPKNHGVSEDELDHRVQNALEAVELTSVSEADPFNLSKGERQRVALGSILSTEPEAVVLDEPTTGLDASRKERLMGLITRWNQESELTAVLITHDLSTVIRYATRTIVLQNGRIVADGPTRKLFSELHTPRWGLVLPQIVVLSNRLGTEDALPALSVNELVEGLGGEP